ncbi:MAG: hypothetical protein ACYTDT_11255 [Planctomycetota bacterium]
MNRQRAAIGTNSVLEACGIGILAEFSDKAELKKKSATMLKARKTA